MPHEKKIKRFLGVFAEINLQGVRNPRFAGPNLEFVCTKLELARSGAKFVFEKPVHGATCLGLIQR
jgi:hypothetical protein